MATQASQAAARRVARHEFLRGASTSDGNSPVWNGQGECAGATFSAQLLNGASVLTTGAVDFYLGRWRAWGAQA